MTTLRVLIDTDNAAFTDEPASELGRILRDVATRVEDGAEDLRDGLTLRDVNGNAVGRAQMIGGRA